MNRNYIIPAAAVAIGLIFLGLMIPRAVRVHSQSQRTVTVKGLCEREVAADKVIWPIKYKTVSNNLQEIYSDIATKDEAICRFLEEGGVGKDEITVSMPAISDKYAQEYGNNERTYRFVASRTITVCSKDVEKVKALMNRQTEMIKKGISIENDWESQVIFSFEGLNNLKPEMIQEATKNAREVALKFAADSQSELGKIKQASQGTFSIEDRDANTPSVKRVRVVTNIVYYLSN